MGIEARRFVFWVLTTFLLALTSCMFDDRQQQVHDDELSPEEAIASSVTDRETNAACTSNGHDADVNTVWSYINTNCGGISSCGTLNHTNTHVDVYLSSGDYCNCYSKLWGKRLTAPYSNSNMQIIYHEPGSCSPLNGGRHIHIKKFSATCGGNINYDVDEGGGQDCFDDEPLASWDRYYGNGNCSAGGNGLSKSCNN